jgi:hypothetical protein
MSIDFGQRPMPRIKRLQLRFSSSTFRRQNWFEPMQRPAVPGSDAGFLASKPLKLAVVDNRFNVRSVKYWSGSEPLNTV